MTIEEELLDLKTDLGIIDKKLCSNKEDKIYAKMLKDGLELPEGIKPNPSTVGSFMKITINELSSEEIQELMLYRQTRYIRSIKSAVTFIAFIIGIPAIIGFLMFFGGLASM